MLTCGKAISSASSISHDEVLKYAARFMQYYRENAKYLERTYGFVERIGIEKIRAVDRR